MPTRGYRKGVSDDKTPAKKSVRTHISEHEFRNLKEHASYRSQTMSGFLRSMVKAQVQNKGLETPHAKRDRALLREMARIGNNLNQLSRQANTGIVTVGEGELRPVIDKLNAAMKKL